SFVAMRFAGRSVDRWGSFRVGSVSSVAVILLVYFWLVVGLAIPIMAVFIAFMTVNAFRNVAYNTLTSKGPAPGERARFMSIQSTVQHAGMGLGAILSGFILASEPDGKLLHFSTVAVYSIALTAVVPFLLWAVERRVTPRAP